MKHIYLLLLSLFVGQGLYCQDFNDVEIKISNVADKVYMLQGMGGNIGLFTGPEGTLMIDSQFAPLSEKIRAAINSLTDNPVHYLVNTHWHGDHTGGNENFGSAGAFIVAHQNVRARLSTDQVRPFRGTTPAAPPMAWPAITFDEKMQLHFNGESIELIHIHNAHTDGDAMVYFPVSNVLHMGDCFFNHLFPYIDLASGGSPEGAIRAVEAALMIADDETVIIPGHGKIATKEDLENYHSMYLTMRDRINSALKAGMTVEQALEDKITEGYEDWVWSFINEEKFVKMMYESYSL